jgi:hypothetical protein
MTAVLDNVGFRRWTVIVIPEGDVVVMREE